MKILDHPLKVVQVAHFLFKHHICNHIIQNNTPEKKKQTLFSWIHPSPIPLPCHHHPGHPPPHHPGHVEARGVHRGALRPGGQGHPSHAPPPPPALLDVPHPHRLLRLHHRRLHRHLGYRSEGQPCHVTNHYVVELIWNRWDCKLNNLFVCIAISIIIVQHIYVLRLMSLFGISPDYLFICLFINVSFWFVYIDVHVFVNLFLFIPLLIYYFYCLSHRRVEARLINPNPIGGGGGLYGPPCHFFRRASRPIGISRSNFMTFLSQVSRIFWYIIHPGRSCRTDVRGR